MLAVGSEAQARKAGATERYERSVMRNEPLLRGPTDRLHELPLGPLCDGESCVYGSMLGK
jgi:hypothetical protein